MLGPWTRPRRAIAVLFLLSTIFLTSWFAAKAYGGATVCPPDCANTNLVDASPGKYDLKLGAGFPTFGPVKLSYPDSTILANSVGDLLFAVTLNPLMLNRTSGQVGNMIKVWGSGFSLSDTSCTLSGGSVSSPSCMILSGILTGSFTVADALAGVYTITGTGNRNGDFSSTTFTVLPPSLVLNPSSGPTGVGLTVSVSGLGFFSTDSSCSLTGTPGPPTLCSIAGGSLSDTFMVTSSVGTYTITATTNGADTDEAVNSFTVTTSSQFIVLSSSSGMVGAGVTVTGSGFSLADTSCTLSGRIVSSPTSCSIIASTITGPPAFAVSNVAPGVYTVTVTGAPGGDFATANFQVTPSPPSTPTSTQVSLAIYIPPEFLGVTLGKTWTSFTNNYDPHILSVSRLGASDQIGPNWWRISVSGLTVTHTPSVFPTPLVEHLVFAVNETQYIRLFQVTSPSIAGRYFFKAFINGASVGSQNFPTLVVKGSRDPAYVSGFLRESGAHNPLAAGQPIQLPNGTGARILASGIDYLGRSASAQTFINSTAGGRYTLFGVAPGTYNITAYAAGYIPTTKPTTVSVGAAQSLEAVDIYLTRSVNITGRVLSKNAAGSLIPWGSVSGFNGTAHRPITIRLLTLNNSLVASTPAPYGVKDFTTPASTSFDFSIQREVGFDGRIPQDYANYTSGITSGDYLLYAYVTSYIQLEEVRVHVGNETVVTFSEIPLIRTGILDVIVHFRNQNSTSTIGEDQIQSPAVLAVSAYDQRGILRAQNTTFVGPRATSAAVELIGFSSSRSFGSFSSQNYGILPGTYQIIATVTSSPIYSGFANVGVRDLYFQLTNVQATIGLGDGVVIISFPVYKAGGINLTINSIDDQIPSIKRSWGYPGSTVGVTIIDRTTGTVYQSNASQPVRSASVNFAYVGLLTDSYDIVIQTLGYTQREIIHLNVLLGGVADGSVWMIKNPVIDLDVVFRHEGLLTNITSTLPFAQPINHIGGTPARIEVFDERGRFVAANATYVPNNATIAHFRLAGFNLYYGDPRFIWSGFYDTTDALGQLPGGLFLYPWNDLARDFIVRIWIDGYYQTDRLHVTVPARHNASLVEAVDRASRISGTVLGPDYFDYARLLSWAAVTLQPNNDTLTRIIDVRPGNYTTFSLDGSFQVWVPGGSYGMGVSLAGYSRYESQIPVPWGSDIYMAIWLDNYQPSALAVAARSQNSIPMLYGETSTRRSKS